MLEIRQFKPTDTFSVIKIASDSLPEQYNPSLFSYFYEANPETFLIAEFHHRIIGFLVGIPLNKNVAKILMIAVEERYRKQKTGTKILERFIEILNHHKIKNIELEVRIDNTKGIEFYKNKGFEIIEKINDFYQDGNSAYTMRLNLSN